MRKMRNGSVFVLGFAWMLLPSSADAAPSGTGGSPEPQYKRLEPVPPNPDLQAKPVYDACVEIVKHISDLRQEAKLDRCKGQLEEAYTFCSKPLLTPDRPPTDDLKRLSGAECPVVTKDSRAAGALVETKSLPPGIVPVEWQEQVLKGVATFMVQRAKAEMLAFFAEGLKTTCADKSAIALLPMTCGLLQSSDPGTSTVSWGALKSAAEGDLTQMPIRMVSMAVPMDSQKYKDTAEILYVMIDVIEQVVAEGRDPLWLLAGMEKRYQSAAGQCSERPAACGLLLVGIASQVVPFQEFRIEIAATKEYAMIAGRLIVDEAKRVKLIPPSPDAAWEGAVVSAVQVMANRFAVLKATTSEKKSADISRYAGSLTSLTAAVLSKMTPTIAGPQVAEIVGRAPSMLEEWMGMWDAARRHDFLRVAAIALALPNKLGLDSKLPRAARLLPFLADLANAKDQAEVQAVVEAAAEPVGAYRGKRGWGNHMLSINGYLGGQAGWERLVDSQLPASYAFRFGVFAPLGIESSWGLPYQSSIGIFLSILDLGAMVDFRTSTEQATQSNGQQVAVERSPHVGFAQVFSPGAFVVIGVPYAPLALGGGVAMTPDLRRIDVVETGAREEATALRLSLFVAVDLTMFRL